MGLYIEKQGKIIHLSIGKIKIATYEFLKSYKDGLSLRDLVNHFMKMYEVDSNDQDNIIALNRAIKKAVRGMVEANVLEIKLDHPALAGTTTGPKKYFIA